MADEKVQPKKKRYDLEAAESLAIQNVSLKMQNIDKDIQLAMKDAEDAQKRIQTSREQLAALNNDMRKCVFQIMDARAIPRTALFEVVDDFEILQVDDPLTFPDGVSVDPKDQAKPKRPSTAKKLLNKNKPRRARTPRSRRTK